MTAPTTPATRMTPTTDRLPVRDWAAVYLHAIDAALDGQDGYYVWSTSDGSNVCDECQDLDGEQFEDLADADFPAHPNCNCTLSFVRLRGRSKKQRALARRRSKLRAKKRREIKAEEKAAAKKRRVARERAAKRKAAKQKTKKRK